MVITRQAILIHSYLILLLHALIFTRFHGEDLFLSRFHFFLLFILFLAYLLTPALIGDGFFREVMDIF